MKDTALYGRCPACGHITRCCTLPASMPMVSHAAKTKCCACGAGKLLLVPEAEFDAQEDRRRAAALRAIVEAGK